ncbi:TIGR04222 domain-containing membrane protein [filamentous cyanobacterium LEGE 11480]|uniref:TIGR04222 domain-containing membrane protein n=2 Tax=Romeriopsis TaxID=2992131 RepID=A0A928VRU6_9CYAN|nr:TIGR04222 domain-containing membrane protein [Romeriopsis navalis LEGE 11480]
MLLLTRSSLRRQTLHQRLAQFSTQQWLRRLVPGRYKHYRSPLRTFGLYFLLANLMVSCRSNGFVWNPLEMSGWSFFGFYLLLNIVLFVVIVIGQVKICASDRRRSPVTPALTIYEMARLTDIDKSSSEHEVLFSTVITKLLAQGHIQLFQPMKNGRITGSHKIKLTQKSATFTDPIEQLVAQTIEKPEVAADVMKTAVSGQLKSMLQPMHDRMQQLNLLLHPAVERKQNDWAQFIFSLSGLLCLLRVFADISRGQSSWWFSIITVFVFLIAWVLGQDSNRLNDYGQEVLVELKKKRQALDHSNLNADELAMSVALLGPDILKASTLSELYLFLKPVEPEQSDDDDD